MNKFLVFRNLYVCVLVLAVLAAIYTANLVSESFQLSEGVMSPELKQQYDQCEELANLITQKVDVPFEVFTPSRKAIYCQIHLSFFMEK